MTSVLIVDDDPDLRLLLRVTLAERGFTIVGEAGDGEQGVSQASLLHPDVIVLDLAMPIMDGLTTLSLLTELAPHSPVVVLSATDDQAAKARAEALGARGFVHKPTTAEALARALIEAKLASASATT